jgi:hypothetical protein
MSNEPDVPGQVQTLLSILYQHSNRRIVGLKRSGCKFAHYTSAENALNILAGRSLWLRNAAVMNDHSEIEHGRIIHERLLEGPLGKRLWAALNYGHGGISNTIRVHFNQHAQCARDQTCMIYLCEH